MNLREKFNVEIANKLAETNPELYNQLKSEVSTKQYYEEVDRIKIILEEQYGSIDILQLALGIKNK